MRIGLVCPYDMSAPGGVQSQVSGLAKTLAERGDDVTILAPGLGESGPGIDLGPTHVIPGNGSRVPLSIDPRVRHSIRRAAESLDVLHVHEPLMPTVSVSALRAETPVVATFHAAPSRWGRAFYSFARPGMRRLLGPWVRQVSAVSPVAAEPLPPDLEVTIVPNGVDLSIFDVGGHRAQGRVCFLGRDERRKGLDVLLEAWPKVQEAVAATELVVMGARREQPGISWMGRVDDAEKAKTLASSAVYVAPNEGGESFGIVLVEAMASGTPVVASDLESFRAVGADAVRYFEAGNADDLASTLVAVLSDDLERARMSRTGKEWAAQFDWSHVAGAYRSLYEAALS